MSGVQEAEVSPTKLTTHLRQVAERRHVDAVAVVICCCQGEEELVPDLERVGYEPCVQLMQAESHPHTP